MDLLKKVTTYLDEIAFLLRLYVYMCPFKLRYSRCLHAHSHCKINKHSMNECKRNAAVKCLYSNLNYDLTNITRTLSQITNDSPPPSSFMHY